MAFVGAFLLLSGMAYADKTDDILKGTSELTKKTDELSKKAQDTLDICAKIDNKPIMTTAGTEYGFGESAKVFIRLLNGNSRPINLAQCNTTLYYPNTTKFLNNEQMTLLENGYYYKDFTTPSLSGVYILGFDCIFPSGIYSDIKILNYGIGASPTTYTGTFPFDNYENITINSAWILFNVTGGGGGANNDYYFNEQYLGSGSGVSQVMNYTLNQSRFHSDSEQDFTVVRTALSSTINSVRLYVNYTFNQQSTIIRGQNEIHIKDDAVNSVILALDEHDANLNFTRSYLESFMDGRFDSIDTALSNLATTVSGIITDISNIPSAVWSFEPRNVSVTNTTNYVNTVYNVSDDVLQDITDSVMNAFIAHKDKLLTLTLFRF